MRDMLDVRRDPIYTSGINMRILSMRFLFAVCLAIGVCPICVLSSPASTGSHHVAYINAPRPLLLALDLMQDAYGARINYVEPARGDDPSRSRPTAPGRTYLIPNEQIFTYQLDTALHVSDSINRLLREYEKADVGSRFKVATNESADAYTVLPVAWPGRSTSSAVSVFETRMSLDASERKTVREWVASVFSSISQSSPHEDKVMRIPTGGSGGYQPTVSVSASDLPAYQLIDELCGNRRKSWAILRPAGIMDGKRVSYMKFSSIRLQNAGADRHVYSKNPRPLNYVLDVLEREYGVPIHYEGPDLEDRGLYHGDGNSNTVKGGYFPFHYASTQTVENVLQDLVASKGCEFAATRFEVSRERGQRYVYPSLLNTWVDRKRVLLPVVSLSSRPVTISFEDESFMQAVTDLCALASEQYSIPLQLDLSSPVPHGDSIVSYAAKGEPLGAVLSRCAALCNPLMSWRILYHPNGVGYVLRFHLVEGVGSANSSGNVGSAAD
jgi:hypothetical protein